jgi:hypothetical protein
VILTACFLWSPEKKAIGQMIGFLAVKTPFCNGPVSPAHAVYRRPGILVDLLTASWYGNMVSDQ